MAMTGLCTCFTTRPHVSELRTSDSAQFTFHSVEWLSLSWHLCKLGGSEWNQTWPT